MLNDLNNIIELNSGRSCLRYIVRAFNIKEIYIPFYTCPVVWQTLKQEKCKIFFYHIDENFMPAIELPKNAYIIYTNYFGICAKNLKALSVKYKNLIADNAQAFFMFPLGIASFYSIRKFLPVKDGAILYSDKHLTNTFYQDNTEITDINCEENTASISSKEILLMSERTKKLAGLINTDEVREKRLKNFEFLHKFLNKINGLKIVLDKDDVPMYYPYLCYDEETEKKLIKNKINVERLWNPQKTGSQEGIFQKKLLLLPVNQMYSTDDMQRIISIIKEH